MPEPRNPHIPSADLGPASSGLTLTAPGASVSIAEAREDDSFVVDRNAQAAFSVADSIYALATGRITFMHLGIEPLAK